MRYGSVCSGIEAATVAWKPLGWEASWFAEIEKFPSAVLKHHYPDVPNLGDITDESFTHRADGPIEVLVGGTPCQSFSVAGLRGGLEDSRGNLALRFMQLVNEIHPTWVVWENVPGVLSSNGGRDFGSILGSLDQLGYGWAYRILDAQYFRVPQRRRRVFVVGYLGDWRPPIAVLFERESLSRDLTPRRKEGEEVTSDAGEGAAAGGSQSWTVSKNSSGFSWMSDVAPTVDTDPTKNTNQQSGVLVPASQVEPPVTQNAYADNESRESLLVPSVASTLGEKRRHDLDNETYVPECALSLNAHANRSDYETENFVVNAREDPIHCSGKDLPLGAKDTGHAIAFQSNLGTQGGDIDTNRRTPVRANAPPAVAFTQNQVGDVGSENVSHAISTNSNATGRNSAKCLNEMQVRRLTPRECERLQGFPDDYTLIPWRKKMATDGPRYKAIGNSMAVPVMRWIGERIQKVKEIIDGDY